MFHDLAPAKGTSLKPPKQDYDWIGQWSKGASFLQLTAHYQCTIYDEVVNCLAFSPDGKHLATGGTDGVIYIWKVAHFFQRPALPPAPAKVADLWPVLADADPAVAYPALAQLEAAPKESVALLRQHLRPAKLVDEKTIRKHIKDLDADNFAVREKAKTWLLEAGDQALPFLTAEVQAPASVEAKLRLEAVLERVELPFEKGDSLRAYRCVTLLERLGTADARALLAELAEGAPGAWLTVEARYALEKLGQGDKTAGQAPHTEEVTSPSPRPR
jgi:hypothetical protein